jgi:hypothetical protein
MREADTSPVRYGRYEKDESIFGLSDLASLAAIIYLLFFLLVLVIYSANPSEPAGFYKLSVLFQIVSFFGIFFVPTLLIYFALGLTKSLANTVVVLGYPILVLGAAATINIPDAPIFAALSGLVLFAFYFLVGLNRSAIEQRRPTPRAQRAARQRPVVPPPPRLPPQRRPSNQRAPLQRQQMSQYVPPTRPSDFKQEVRPQYRSSNGFRSRLDRFLDRYDYVDGEAVRKGSRRNVRYERDRRRGGR